ncbi:ribosome recycling factor [Butyricicoccus sp.]|jgi:ribosome recycling factor|uniref:ribosome recycling factor n=1 Tax=Butyricicoccus sp. TaxID=2049021 RepID=UPI003D7C3ED5
MKPDLKPYEVKMQKSLDVLAENLAGIRAGRANASVLNKITVDYYGTASPIQQVAAVASPDPRTLTIQPWDASLLKEIVKAIQTSELGINPQNDGKLIRLSFPPLTEERRKELIKQVSKEGEASKVAIRNIRRDAIDKWKAAKKKSEITEDELADAEKDMQKLTDKYTKEIDKTTAAKSEELKSV